MASSEMNDLLPPRSEGTPAERGAAASHFHFATSNTSHVVVIFIDENGRVQDPKVRVTTNTAFDRSARGHPPEI